MKITLTSAARVAAALALLASPFTATAASAASGDYTIAKSYALGGDGGWDYLIYDPIRYPAQRRNQHRDTIEHRIHPAGERIDIVAG